MGAKVIITASIEDWWGYSDMVSDGMTDDEIIEVLKEDISSLLEDATWELKGPSDPPGG